MAQLQQMVTAIMSSTLQTNFLIIKTQTMRKTLLIVLLIICTISLRMHQEEPKQIRLRRSIHTLNETERKSLFWCIKMMAVMPAPISFQNRTFVSFTKLPQGNATMQPLRVIDILISHHTTSCEHSSFYFAYFHRHLMIMSEVWLNYVHGILRAGKERFLELFQQKNYFQHQQQWDSVFEDYAVSGAANISFISLHYWNPTNYKNRDDILVPIELSSPTMYPEKQLDAVDKLYKAVLGYWPWETNVKTRLTSPNFKGSQAQLQKQLEDLEIFDRINETQKLTPDEENLYKHTFTPRTQPEGEDFDDFLKTYRNFQNTKNRNGTFISHTRNRFRKYYETVGEKTLLPLCAVTEQDDYIMYGAQIEFQKEGKLINVSQQYISKEERRRMNLVSPAVKDYNALLPQYSAAHGFFNRQTLPTFKDYLKKTQGIEWPHSQMHGYKGIFLKDGLYSILTLFFYPFHGLIDALLETKIRLSNYEDRAENTTHYQTLKDYLENGEKKSEVYRLKIIVDQETDAPYKSQTSAILDAEFQSFYAQLAANKQSIFPSPIEPSKVGSHLVIQWTNHFINTTLIENKTVDKAFIAAYPMRDAMLTSNRLRTSKELGDLYRNTYVKNNGWRFEGLVDIANFPFDYDYQVYNGPEQINPTLDENSSNIAKYLRDMRQDMDDTYDLLLPSLRNTISSIVSRNFSEFSIDSSQEKTLLVADPQVTKQNLAVYYQPLLLNTSFTYVHYPAAIPAQFYPLTMRLLEKTCLSRVQNLLRNWNVSSDLIDELNEGIEVQSLNVQQCREQCSVEKRIILQLGADLLETNRALWKALRVLQLGEDEVLKDSRQSSFSDCLSQTLQITGPQEQEKIHARFLRGTERIRIFVDVEEVSQEKRVLLQKSIKVIAKAAAVGEDEAVDTVSIRSEAYDAKGAKFYFWSIEPSSQPKVTNHIDALLYKRVQIQWNNAVVLDFDIPFYSKSTNFRLFVGLNESSAPYFRLEDADFAVKQQFLVQAWLKISD